MGNRKKLVNKTNAKRTGRRCNRAEVVMM